MVNVGFILPSSHTTIVTSPPQLTPITQLEPTWCPSPLMTDVGPSPMETTAQGKEKREGGPMKREAQVVRQRTSHDFLSWFVLGLFLFLVTVDHLA